MKNRRIPRQKHEFWSLVRFCGKNMNFVAWL